MRLQHTYRHDSWPAFLSGHGARLPAFTDMEAPEAFQLSCSTHGIIPVLGPSHALSHAMKIAPDPPRDHIIAMNMCGRGDKDVRTVANHLGVDMSDAVSRAAD